MLLLPVICGASSGPWHPWLQAVQEVEIRQQDKELLQNSWTPSKGEMEIREQESWGIGVLLRITVGGCGRRPTSVPLSGRSARQDLIGNEKKWPFQLGLWNFKIHSHSDHCSSISWEMEGRWRYVAAMKWSAHAALLSHANIAAQAGVDNWNPSESTDDAVLCWVCF